MVAKGVSSTLERNSRPRWGKAASRQLNTVQSKQTAKPPQLNSTSGNRGEGVAVTSSLGFPSHDSVSFIKQSKLLVTNPCTNGADLGRTPGAPLITKMGDEAYAT